MSNAKVSKKAGEDKMLITTPLAGCGQPFIVVGRSSVRTKSQKNPVLSEIKKAWDLAFKDSSAKAQIICGFNLTECKSAQFIKNVKFDWMVIGLNLNFIIEVEWKCVKVPPPK